MATAYQNTSQGRCNNLVSVLQGGGSIAARPWHKSWYVHYLVWIVPRMIFLHGDLWRFCTAAMESRGARLKRMGRTVICWRPYQEGNSVYHYIDHRTGEEVTREQSYKSSPMEQMLSKMLAQEVAWHSDSVFVRPTKLRLQHELRRRRLKC